MVITMVDHRMTCSAYRYAIFVEMFLLIVFFTGISSFITIDNRRDIVATEIHVNGCAVSCGIVTEVFGTDIRIEIRKLSC